MSNQLHLYIDGKWFLNGGFFLILKMIIAKNGRVKGINYMY